MSRESSSTRPVVSTNRENAVRNALSTNSLEELQQLSLLTGGFGKARGQAWPSLLGVVPLEAIDESTPNVEELSLNDPTTGLSNLRSRSLDSLTSTGSEDRSTYVHDSLSDASHHPHTFSDASNLSHPDEHQVQLDTNRSFILYPVVDNSASQRKRLQEDLHDIILGVLRRRPALRYFQGYHDIITVLLLTLPEDLVLPTAEKLSLHRLRDSMGDGLEPLIGQLRILKRLLRMIDPPYAEILERNSTLPYYALSNLLTLFAHDIPTLPLIQHVFDWLLCHEPVASIWLAAAVILSRKEDVLALDRQGEEAMGMVHAVLSALPPLAENDLFSSESRKNSLKAMHTSSDDGKPEDDSALSPMVIDETKEETEATSVNSPGNDIVDLSDDSLMDSWMLNSPQTSASHGALPVVDFKGDPDFLETDAITPDADGGTELEMTSEKAHSQPKSSSSQSLHRPSSSPSHLHSLPSASRSFPGELGIQRSPPPLPLTALLRHASSLLATYPPSSLALRLTETLGPQSALRPNDLTVPASSVFPNLPPDDIAESYVGGDNVVLPLSQEEEQEEEESFSSRSRSDQNRGSDAEKKKIWRNNPRWRHTLIVNGFLTVMRRRQALIAGVVLLLGVAVALYGFTPGGKGAGGRGGMKMGIGKARYIAAWVGGSLRMRERWGVGLWR